MELSNILPKNERTTFPDPGQHVDPQYRRLAEQFEACRRSNDSQISDSGYGILDILQTRKSKMSVRTLITIFTNIVRDEAMQYRPAVFVLPRLTGQSFEKITEGYAIAAIKYLANDGFIKLSEADKFENREVLQYHATAEPEFRNGKFHL